MEAFNFPDHFDATVLYFRDRYLIGLDGELDLASADPLERLLFGLAGSTVVIDVTQLTFVDSSGLRALLRAHRLLSLAGECLIKGPWARNVERLLRLSGLAALLPADSGLRAPPPGRPLPIIDWQEQRWL